MVDERRATGGKGKGVFAARLDLSDLMILTI